MGVFAAPTADLGKAKNTTAFGMVNSLELAVNLFHNEYGNLPGVAGHVVCEGPEGVKLLKILIGADGGGNGNKIKFLPTKEARNRKNGLQYSNAGTGLDGFFDPWGHPFVVELNLKKSGKLRFHHGNKVVELPGRLVAVYSVGKDGKAGTGDDITSWEN